MVSPIIIWILQVQNLQYESENTKGLRRCQPRLHEVIYESETTAGKVFDIALLMYAKDQHIHSFCY